jgi:YD repeat-containing protein
VDDFMRSGGRVSLTAFTHTTYDAITGQPASITTGQGTIRYAHDPVTGQHTRTWTDDDDVSYGYDLRGRLQTVHVTKLAGQSVDQTTTYAYDLLGNLHSDTQANGVVTTYSYDTLNRLTDVVATRTGNNLFTQHFTLCEDGLRCGRNRYCGDWGTVPIFGRNHRGRWEPSAGSAVDDDWNHPNPADKRAYIIIGLRNYNVRINDMTPKQIARQVPRDFIPPNPILWVENARRIEPLDDSFANFLDLHGRRFPDGSIYVAGREVVLAFYELLQPHRERVPMRDATQFRPLLCFGLPPTEYYSLSTSYDYFERIGGEEAFGVSPLAPDAKPGESKPAELLVRVRFWGGLERAARPRFFKATVAWADSVGASGIFQEGPAFLLLESFLFDRRSASFRIDVSGSGQHTVNWLTLCVLNFGAQGDYVSTVSYGDNEIDALW